MTNSGDPEDVLDLKGAAALLKVGPETMSKYAIKYGLGKKVGHLWRFSRRKIFAFLEGTPMPAPKGSAIEPEVPPLVETATGSSVGDVQKLAGEMTALLQQPSRDWAAIERLGEQLQGLHASPANSATVPAIRRKYPRRRRVWDVP